MMRRRRRSASWTVTLVTLLAVATVAAPEVQGENQKTAWVEAIQAQTEIPEELLLDVGVQFFSPGLPEEDESALEEKGVFADIRKSEARYIPVHLVRTLQATGHWGAVRVIPGEAEFVDVSVGGEILESNGRELFVRIEVEDATGRPWFERKYKHVALPAAYAETEELEDRDPHQSLYNRIANDLLDARQPLDEKDVRRIREVARLRFAADLLPAAFGDYVSVNKKGHYRIERLPAQGDPMMLRVARIRERDHLFVDTINEYYSGFYARMDEPYDEWRSFSFEEQIALRKLRREARLEKILGAVAIVGAATVSGTSSASRAARSAAAVAGTLALQDGLAKGKEAKIHVEALKELAQSFDADVAPLLVDVEGETVRLTGSIEEQYGTWRQLLKDLFATETGFTIDPNDGNLQEAVGQP